MAVALLVSAPLFAQGNNGTIQGSVFDQSGGAIAGAKVTIIDASRGLNRPLTVDSAGAYVAANVTPGTYTVRAEANGFQTLERSNVQVGVGQNIRVDLVLQPGAQTQTVTVTSEAPSVDTTDATLGGTVNNEQINDLPLNGRNFQRLLLLRPGTVGAIGRGTGLESTNGLRTGENLTMVQGLAAIGNQQGGSVLNLSYHQGDSGSLLPLDAIQEFNVEQNYKAEYGWKPGAAVNIGVRSGTNDFHGTAYAFGRTDALDASNYYTQVTPISLVQPGASLGGRIIKNKLFFFAAFEALNYSVGDVALDPVPSFDPNPENVGATPGDPKSQLTIFDACSAITGNNPLNFGKINPLSALIAGLPTAGGVITSCVPQKATSSFENMFPFVTTAPTGGNAVLFAPGLTTTNPFYDGLAKIDYNINDHHHLNGLFFRSEANSTVQQNLGQLFSYWQANQQTGARDYALTEVWTPNSNWVNELRGGYAYLHYHAVPNDYLTNPANPWGIGANGVPTGYGIPTGVAPVAPVVGTIQGGSPQIKISSFSPSFLGQGGRLGDRGPEGTVDIRDDVSWLHGLHAFKFGFEHLLEINDNHQYNTGNGVVSFKDLQNFLKGNPKGNNGGSIAISNEDTRDRMNQYAAYIQDDWRVKRTVTLNLGLRWEYNGRPYEVLGNYIGDFNPNVPAGTSPLVQVGGPFQPKYKPDWSDFAPRFGLAWDVFGNGKTVVRGGAGLIYNFDVLGSLIDLIPFGANIPSIGLNNSGKLVNLFTADVPSLPGSSINWKLNGSPVFPLAPQLITGAGGVQQLYSGATCTYPNDTSGLALSLITQCQVNETTNPNFHTPKIVEWNVDIQRAITNNLTVEASYVGNHGWEASRLDINQPPFGWGWNGPTPTVSGLGGLSVNNFCLTQQPNPLACLASPPTISAGSGVNTSLIGEPVNTYNEITGSPYFSSFPYLGNIDETNNFDFSNYNALQVTVTERPSHGLTFLAGYTFAHALDIVSSSSVSNDATDAYNLRLNYGNGDNDIRNRFTFSATYDLPGIKFPAQILQGWSASFIVAAYGGAPWSVNDTSNDFWGTNEINNSAGQPLQTWNFQGNPSTFTMVSHGNIPCFGGGGSLSGCTPFPTAGSFTYPNGLTLLNVPLPPAACQNAAIAPYGGSTQLQTLALMSLQNNECYTENGDVLTPPAYGTRGDLAKNVFHGQPYYNVDFSVGKLWKFKERYTATFRIEFFNFLNRPDFASPGTDPTAGAFGASQSTPDGAGFTNAVLGSGSARAAQLGLKLTF